jgi:hypothetical protein
MSPLEKGVIAREEWESFLNRKSSQERRKRL